MDERVQTRQGSTVEVDEARAVQELRQQLHMSGTSVVVFFCSPRHDLARLARELRGAFDVPLVGCTTAGQIGPKGFQPTGIVGGSPGDDLAFERTHVYADGEFRTDAAVLALCETTLPFTTFKHQHFVPGSRRMVITSADAGKRLVREIDGRPAVEAYAEALGIPVAELGPATFSRRPFVLWLGDDVYVRSVQRVHDDGTLSFLCAIDEGIVVRLGEAIDPLSSVEKAFEEVRTLVPQPALVLGCDCILRRIELEERGVAEAVGRVYVDNHVVGFSTYGEQFNAAHVNQTFTGIAIGG